MKVKKLYEFSREMDPYGEEDWPEDFDIIIEKPEAYYEKIVLKH